MADITPRGAFGDFGDVNGKDSGGDTTVKDWTTSLETAFKGQGFLSGLSGLFDSRVLVKKGKLDEALQAVTDDASNPAALANYQAALAEYTLFRNAQSNAVKAYKDVDANTIRNFN